jgi:peptidyl-Asp metalloendopeptidase
MKNKTFASIKSIIIIISLTLIITSSAYPDTTPSQSPPLFESIEAESPRMALDPAEPQVLRKKVVNVNFALLCDLEKNSIEAAARGKAPSTALTLNLFDDVTLIARIHTIEPTKSGGFSGVGYIEGSPGSETVMVVTGDIMSLNVNIPGTAGEPNRFFQVRYQQDGIHKVQEIDQTQFPTELPGKKVEMDRTSAPDTSSTDVTSADTGSTIDILVVYTATARSAAGGTTAMENLIDLAITETNTGYSNSGVNQRLRLVHTEEVSYSEVGFNWSTALSHLKGTSDGYIDNVHTLRDTYGADEVAMIVNNSVYCGMGYVMQYVNSSFATSAFCLVSRTCATGNYSFAHELGHNMGCAHDRANAGVTGAYDYSYGYQAPDNAWRTIMAYNCTVSCSRLNYWSNPDVSYGGQAMGVIYTSPSAADNRRALNNTAYTVANFRQAVAQDAVTVTSPNGGESWQGGTTHSITWTTTGTVGNVKIEYSTAGTNGSYVTITSSTTNDGSYSWTVPDANSSLCFIRITDIDGSPSDKSNSAFTITPVPSVTVTSPNGGEVWQTNSTVDITWTSVNATGSVNLQLYKNNVYQQTIDTVSISPGTYRWTIPAGLAAGADYKIGIFQGSMNDYSNNNFSITTGQVNQVKSFSGDYKPDILWRYYASSSTGINMVWVMDGITKTGSNIWLQRVADPDWKIVGTGDFNSDQKIDILWRYHGSSSTGINMVWYMDGTTKIGNNVWLKRLADPDWKIEGTGDFNGDGKTDILWRYYGTSSTGINMVWYMDGATKIGTNAWLQRVADPNWKIEATGDFNSDGKTDILWRYYGSSSTGINMVWYMDGITKIGSNVWLQRVADPYWKIEGTGDFNSDGKTDILWRYHNPASSSGINMVWYMDGVTKIGSNVWLRRLADLNWEIQN